MIMTPVGAAAMAGLSPGKAWVSELQTTTTVTGSASSVCESELQMVPYGLAEQAENRMVVYTPPVLSSESDLESEPNGTTTGEKPTSGQNWRAARACITAAAGAGSSAAGGTNIMTSGPAGGLQTSLAQAPSASTTATADTSTNGSSSTGNSPCPGLLVVLPNPSNTVTTTSTTQAVTSHDLDDHYRDPGHATYRFLVPPDWDPAVFGPTVTHSGLHRRRDCHSTSTSKVRCGNLTKPRIDLWRGIFGDDDSDCPSEAECESEDSETESEETSGSVFTDFRVDSPNLKSDAIMVQVDDLNCDSSLAESVSPDIIISLSHSRTRSSFTAVTVDCEGLGELDTQTDERKSAAPHPMRCWCDPRLPDGVVRRCRDVCVVCYEIAFPMQTMTL